ncbi:UDP-N-acetylmuramoylalanine--D-glutamate ligase [Thermosyntropha lipolytica DSM 11003]|uniref:UDP-N-acetylmuramoylalanine--D-glutamate ligase n=1 Tax=Thermosyntropha lipolytica DSM 11003 TaxID=1123382 RepID=A0A1M5NYD9_9FIRM|nr:UDP-N-acetylmuramoyl-L-alanine--D-glutamate ligase [Thermosyntropha lipolytica]SHG94485.1 UDP-N-acetylmuramoylalanine--D-glutamate ligase [Thermosyntropha lipolytica DSM 11003]
MIGELKGKKVLVLGMARSGLAAVEVLLKRGAKVTAADEGKSDKIGKAARILEDKGVQVLVGNYPLVKSDSFDLLVISPGIPLSIEPVQAAYKEGIPVIGELELAYNIKSPAVEIYAVTGTNGKTTTTALLEAILQKSGRNARAAGNIGIPLTSVVDRLEKGVIAAEVSSFQLETAIHFRPHISGILNITPDHLDRHKTFDAYVEAKAKIFARQKKGDFTVLNYDDNRVRNLAAKSKAKVVFFSIQNKLEEGLFIKEGNIIARFNAKENLICSTSDILLKGKHNLENVLCASTMAYLGGVSPEVIRETLTTFRGVRHRMEEVGYIEGVLYVNDSKATNPESAIKALEAYDNPVILIAGGRNKGSRFDELAQVVKKKAKSLILLGEAKEEIKRAVIKAGFSDIYEVTGLKEAVLKAKELAREGDVVLLSPACASWDMFESYEHRGDCFCSAVRELEIKN